MFPTFLMDVNFHLVILKSVMQYMIENLQLKLNYLSEIHLVF